MGRILKIIGIGLLVVVVAFGGAFALGVFGVPAVEGVDNRFGAVNDTNTIIYTDLHVNNPNPVGVQLSGTTVNYTVRMNDVGIANGTKEGVGVSKGNSTLNFTTAMRNEQIPAWWYTHVRNDETTDVVIDATVSSSTLGGQSASFDNSRTIETDIIGQFDSDETRPVDANQPLLSDPVLYINRTRGSWDQSNLTRERTPMDMDFTVYNPKSVPYTVTKIGYNVTMNGIPVGEGETDRAHVINARSTETIRADAAIQNERLDDWWVSHLERNQVTDLYIDFYLVVDVQGEQIRIDPDSIDYETEIETDIFGTKPSATGNESTDGSTETATPTPTPTEDGILDNTTDTDDSLLNQTTETATDDGLLNQTTEEDGLLNETTE